MGSKKFAWGILLFLSAAALQSAEVKPMPVARLLAPVQSVSDVVCDPPRGIDFESSGGSSWALSGNLPNKRTVVVLRPEAGAWDVSTFSFVRMDLVNNGPGLVWIRGRLDNPGAEDWANSTPSSAFIMPGERATLGFPFPRAKSLNDAPPIFNHQSGKPNGHREHWKQFDPSNVTACRLIIESTSDELELEEIQISLAQPYGAEANADLLALPYLDRFGQVRQLDWPGKLHSEEELAARRAAEEKLAANDPGPKAFNCYGGWGEGPQLEATGFFRTEKVNGKWWLVDPLGNLFFSQGANSVGFGQKTPIANRDGFFERLPGTIEKGSARFTVENLIHTFGPDWEVPARERMHQRLRRFGLNTLGAWSDPQLFADKKTPYTAILHVSGNWSPLGHGIADPFSEGFKKNLRKGLSKILGPDGASDPWCVGVFIDNEIDWTEKFVRKTFTLRFDQPARLACVTWLKKKYETIGQLNEAWGTDISSWEAVGPLPGNETKALGEDVTALKRLIAGTYYKACRDAMREVLPNHLYLGSRMHKAPREVMEEAVKSVDVLSLNSYEYLSGAKFPGWADVPCIDTEFHFAAPDRGVPGVGLMPVGDQLQRSRAYVAYVAAGLMHPNMVGTHWFAYTEQSAAGRPGNGENYQIGFVDVTDTPYPEITAYSRQLAERMYSIGTEKEKSLLEVLESLWKE